MNELSLMPRSKGLFLTLAEMGKQWANCQEWPWRGLQWPEKQRGCGHWKAALGLCERREGRSTEREEAGRRHVRRPDKLQGVFHGARSPIITDRAPGHPAVALTLAASVLIGGTPNCKGHCDGHWHQRQETTPSAPGRVQKLPRWF